MHTTNVFVQLTFPEEAILLAPLNDSFKNYRLTKILMKVNNTQLVISIGFSYTLAGAKSIMVTGIAANFKTTKYVMHALWMYVYCVASHSAHTHTHTHNTHN